MFENLYNKELFYGTLLKENAMNLSERRKYKELFSGTLVKENTMNLSEHKELFSGTLVKENTIKIYFIINNLISSPIKYIFLL
jgi:hypothetical protein